MNYPLPIINFFSNEVNYCLCRFPSFVFRDLFDEDFKLFVVLFAMVQIICFPGQKPWGYRPVRKPWFTFSFRFQKIKSFPRASLISLSRGFQGELVHVSSGKLIEVSQSGILDSASLLISCLHQDQRIVVPLFFQWESVEVIPG